MCCNGRLTATVRLIEAQREEHWCYLPVFHFANVGERYDTAFSIKAILMKTCVSSHTPFFFKQA